MLHELCKEYFTVKKTLHNAVLHELSLCKEYFTVKLTLHIAY